MTWAHDPDICPKCGCFIFYDSLDGKLWTTPKWNHTWSCEGCGAVIYGDLLKPLLAICDYLVVTEWTAVLQNRFHNNSHLLGYTLLDATKYKLAIGEPRLINYIEPRPARDVADEVLVYMLPRGIRRLGKTDAFRNLKSDTDPERRHVRQSNKSEKEAWNTIHAKFPYGRGPANAISTMRGWMIDEFDEG